MAARMSYYIEAPVKTVFDFMKDPKSQVDATPFSAMEVLDANMTEEGVGTYMTWRVKFAGIPLEGFDVITELVPNKRILEKSSAAMVGTWEYTFAPEGSGTRLTMEHRQRSLWALPPLRFLMDFLVPRLNAAYIEAVKAELEPGAEVPGQRKPAATKSRESASR